MKTGSGIASGSKTGKRAYPLRKIVGTKFWKPDDAKEWQHEHEYELLECGHLGALVASVGNDMFGTQHADSRRCRECAQLKKDANEQAH